jgi:2-deoxy-D-gluconate 3-dehydrogenase
MTEQHEHLGYLLDLTGSTAIVTGAANGIGRSVALYLARAGASVVIADADYDAARRTTEDFHDEFGAIGLKFLPLAVDVSSEADVKRMVRETLEWGATIDILVNNAGIYPAVPMLDMTTKQFAHVIDVNLRGVFLCSRYVARQMVEQGQGGRIINLTSVDALHPSVVGLAHYDASKHGVWGLTKNLALELAPHRIWVNAVAPGAILTPGVTHQEPAPGVDKEAVTRQFLARIPMGRMGRRGRDRRGRAVPGQRHGVVHDRQRDLGRRRRPAVVRRLAKEWWSCEPIS